MKQWYAKELSKLTQVSVRTLHHYDNIGLLVPGLRLDNGYRLYSEKDLLKLQQIIALKFFGFELSQIKTLLTHDVNVLEHLAMQSQFLQEKAETLLEASSILKRFTSHCSHDRSIPWEDIIKLIEVYRMTQHLENKWVSNILNSEELKEYANFEQELKTRYSECDKKAFEEKWAKLVHDIHANLDTDPASQEGIDLGKQCMTMINKLYGKKYVALLKAIWEKGFKNGHGSEVGLSLKDVTWLDKAIYAYHTDRIRNILLQAEVDPTGPVIDLWETLLTDMYGDDKVLREGLIKEIMSNDKVSQTAKDWVRYNSASI